MQTRIDESRLWRRIQDTDLVAALKGIRNVAEAHAQTILNTLPGFTDHSIRHMDELWNLTSIVLSESEIDKLTQSEAFILGASFYVHDLALSLPATHDGLSKVKASNAYKSHYARLNGLNPDADQIAVQLATRDLHAECAKEYATELLPGLGTYLIENTSIRDTFATTIGEVSASHGLSIAKMNDLIGRPGSIPISRKHNDLIDIGYCACVLRIVDYAHINYSRADRIELALRRNVPIDSLLHWAAQMSISGPTRNDDRLVFASTKPIENTDAWWLFYDIVCGLDAEIRSVREYLQSRTSSKDRFSLEGVSSVQSPKLFAEKVRLANCEPIDIRFRSDSIEHLINLLGGEQLYGDDKTAPLRELLQNSIDSIKLRMQLDDSSDMPSTKGQILVRYDESTNSLSVTDNGVGMSEAVIRNHLLSIASDYWGSQEFAEAYPGLPSSSVGHIGKFGIGFLSVFMWGDRVTVKTRRDKDRGYKVVLEGLSKRGTITIEDDIRIGTSVEIELRAEMKVEWSRLESIIRSRVPMLDIPVSVNVGSSTVNVEPGWWKTTSQKDLVEFVVSWHLNSRGSSDNEASSEENRLNRYRAHRGRLTAEDLYFSGSRSKSWPNEAPEYCEGNCRLMAAPNLADVLIVSKGVAVGLVRMPGLCGIVEVDEIELDAARVTMLDFDLRLLRQDALSHLVKKVTKVLQDSINGQLTPSFYELIEDVYILYGAEPLMNPQLKWISIVEKDGSMTLNSYPELVVRMRALDEVLIGIGVGPWKMCSTPFSHFSEASNNSLLIPVSTKAMEIGTYDDDDDEYIQAPLKEHIRMSRFGRDPHREVRGLLNVVNQALAEAWQVDVELIIDSTWSRHKTNVLCGYLKRQSLVTNAL